jgi:hypothetical protein
MTRNDNKMLKKIERFLTLFFITLQLNRCDQVVVE